MYIYVSQDRADHLKYWGLGNPFLESETAEWKQSDEEFYTNCSLSNADPTSYKWKVPRTSTLDTQTLMCAIHIYIFFKLLLSKFNFTLWNWHSNTNMLSLCMRQTEYTQTATYVWIHPLTLTRFPASLIIEAGSWCGNDVHVRGALLQVKGFLFLQDQETVESGCSL